MQKPSIPEAMTGRELIRELMSNSSLLMQRQVGMARIEAKAQLRQGKVMAELLGTAGGLAHAGVILLLVAAGSAIGAALGMLWLGHIIVAGALWLAAAGLGLVGWRRRVKQPLPRTRQELDKEVSWVKHQMTT